MHSPHRAQHWHRMWSEGGFAAMRCLTCTSTISAANRSSNAPQRPSLHQLCRLVALLLHAPAAGVAGAGNGTNTWQRSLRAASMLLILLCGRLWPDAALLVAALVGRHCRCRKA